MMEEIWKDIPNFKDYQASNIGNIRKINFRNFGITKLLKQSYDKDGYKNVNIYQKKYRTHRIIAMAFLNDYSEDLQVNHKNGIKDDNKIENLEMVTNQQNSFHRTNILKKGKLKSVVMLDKNMRKICIFNSTREAERKTGIEHSSISKVCKGRKHTAGGYIWKYYKEEEK